MLTIRKVTSATSLSKSTIYRLIKVGKFPNSIQLSPRRVGWDAEEISLYKKFGINWHLHSLTELSLVDEPRLAKTNTKSKPKTEAYIGTPYYFNFQFPVITQSVYFR